MIRRENRLSQVVHLGLLVAMLSYGSVSAQILDVGKPFYVERTNMSVCGVRLPEINRPSSQPVPIDPETLTQYCDPEDPAPAKISYAASAAEGDVSASVQSSGFAAGDTFAQWSGQITLQPSAGSGTNGVTFSVTSYYALSAGNAGVASATMEVRKFNEFQFVSVTMGEQKTGQLDTGQLTFTHCPCVFTLSLSVGVSNKGTAHDPFTVNLPSGWTYTVQSVSIPSSTGSQFVPVTPCRIADTRNATGPFGGPTIPSNSSRDFAIPSSACNIPSNAQAYSLNVTAVPHGGLGYLTIWPTGQTQPFVSTLNSLDGRIKANAAIVPAGTNGSVSVFGTNTTDVVLDINGYFVPAGTAASELSFYPVTPCRISDTRDPIGPLGGPTLSGSRTIPVTSACSIPSSAQAYSLNFTVVPHGTLGYLTTWPTGQAQPFVSTLNAPTGAITANAAIVPAGTNGSIDVYALNATDLVIDINGYFAPPGTGGLSFYAVTPCRISDTRNAAGTLGGPSLAPSQTRNWPVPTSSCGIPTTAQAYTVNATVVPAHSLGYLTLWPSGGTQPFVSTLNSLDGSIVANAAIVPAGSSGSISSFVTDASDLILDISGYFAP